MSRLNLEDPVIERPNIKGGIKYGVTQLTDAAQTLDLDAGPVIYMAPSAARIVTLPVVTAAMRGATYIIINGAAGASAITVNNAAGTLIVSVAQNGHSTITCTGEPPSARGWLGA